MKTAAVISELNPLHSGHAGLFRAAREMGADVLQVLEQVVNHSYSSLKVSFTISFSSKDTFSCTARRPFDCGTVYPHTYGPACGG